MQNILDIYIFKLQNVFIFSKRNLKRFPFGSLENMSVLIHKFQKLWLFYNDYKFWSLQFWKIENIMKSTKSAHKFRTKMVVRKCMDAFPFNICRIKLRSTKI